MPGPWGNCLIVWPLPNANIEECKNISAAKLPAQSLATCKALHHKSFTSSESKEAKKLSSLVPRYATIERHLNVVKMILLGTFDEKKRNTFLMLELCLKEDGVF